MSKKEHQMNLLRRLIKEEIKRLTEDNDMVSIQIDIYRSMKGIQTQHFEIPRNEIKQWAIDKIEEYTHNVNSAILNRQENMKDRNYAKSSIAARQAADIKGWKHNITQFKQLLKNNA